MKRSEVVLVDFGMGNLRSVARSMERAGALPRVSADPSEVRSAARVVVPGVGNCARAMEQLRQAGIDDAIRERIAAGRPYLGICLGLQLLLEYAEEGPADALGIIPGNVTRFPDSPGLSIPHMGWNRVETTTEHPVLESGYFYFVHSYRAESVAPDRLLALSDYGVKFPSAVGSGSCVAVQFHPEKSQRAGLALLERFMSWTP